METALIHGPSLADIFRRMSSLEIRPATEADLPSITEIYGQRGPLRDRHVRTHAARSRRDDAGAFRALTDGGFPYFRLPSSKARVVGYAYAGGVPAAAGPTVSPWRNSVYLNPAIHRRGIGLRLMQRLIAECEARGLPADDRG